MDKLATLQDELLDYRDEYIHQLDLLYAYLFNWHRGVKSVNFAIEFLNEIIEIDSNLGDRSFDLLVEVQNGGLGEFHSSNPYLKECYSILSEADDNSDVVAGFWLAKCYIMGWGVQENYLIGLSKLEAVAKKTYPLFLVENAIPENEIPGFDNMFSPFQDWDNLWRLSNFSKTRHGNKIDLVPEIIRQIYKHLNANGKQAFRSRYPLILTVNPSLVPEEQPFNHALSFWEMLESQRADTRQSEHYRKQVKRNNQLNIWGLSREAVQAAEEKCSIIYKFQELNHPEQAQHLFELGYCYLEPGFEYLLQSEYMGTLSYRTVFARQLFKKASDLGHAGAAYYLGLIYQKGLYRDIKADLDYSNTYFSLALSRGYPPAIFRKGVIEFYLGEYKQAEDLINQIAQMQFNSDPSFYMDDESSALAVAKLFFGNNRLKILSNNTNLDIAQLNQLEILFTEVVNCAIERHQSPYPNKALIWNNIAIFANMYIQDVQHSRLILQKEEDKRKALEDLIAMFTHQFNGAVGTIIFNSEHQNDRRIYSNAARAMSGLIKTAGILSTDPAELREIVRKDNSGEGNPESILSSSLQDLIIDLVSVRNRNRMSPHYLAFAKKTGIAPPELKLMDWTREKKWQEHEKAIQSAWDKECQELCISCLDDLLNWIERNLIPFRLTGFSQSTIQFSHYGEKASLLRVIYTEILKNAIKYSTPGSLEPICLSWSENMGEIIFSCTNPSTKDSRMREKSKGGGRGLKFLTMIANNLGGSFAPSVFSDKSCVIFTIPTS